MTDGTDYLDPRVWRAALMTTLAKSNEGLVLCDSGLVVLYATPRATALLQRLSMGHQNELPASVRECVTAQLAGSEEGRVDRLRTTRGEGAIYVRAARVAIASDLSAYAALWLREEILRDERLYAIVQDRFNVSRRGFQLLQLVRKGLTNRQIAEHLNLSESTVKGYLYDLYRACGVSSRTSLLALIDRLLT